MFCMKCVLWVTINYPKAKKTSLYQGIANLIQDTKLFQINDNLDLCMKSPTRYKTKIKLEKNNRGCVAFTVLIKWNKFVATKMIACALSQYSSFNWQLLY